MGPCFACPKLGDAGRTRVASKNRAVLRKTLRPQFSDFSLEIESAIFRIYQNTADSISRLKYENCGRKVFRNTVLGIFFSSRIKGQLRAAVTRPCRLSTPLCHTYSEPSGHELSPGGTQNIPYLFKNLSKSRLSDPFFGLFLVISEVGSQIYIANLAIECFQQLFGMKSHCMP